MIYKNLMNFILQNNLNNLEIFMQKFKIKMLVKNIFNKFIFFR